MLRFKRGTRKGTGIPSIARSIAGAARPIFVLPSYIKKIQNFKEPFYKVPNEEQQSSEEEQSSPPSNSRHWKVAEEKSGCV